VSPGYDYLEGETPVPANRCPNCGGPLKEGAAEGAPKHRGWFRPSRLQKSIWMYRSSEEPATGDTSALCCPACNRTYALAAKT
jgi:uncharacterized protein YbaR (Trm112 family)